MVKQTIDTWLGGNYVGCDKKSGLSLPNFSKVFESYGITLLPTKLIIDKAGNIRHRSFGFRGETELLDELEAVISILNS